jgi:outer membrane protein OmpA-like peptidoglycan-associated protein
MNKLITTMAIIIASLSSYAQTKDLPWQVSLSLGLAEYSGDIGNGFFLFDLTGHNIGQNGVSKKNNPGLGLISVNKYLNSKFDLSFRAYHGEWGYYRNAAEGNYLFRNMTGLECAPRWKFLAMDNAIFVPYLTAGIGFGRINMNASSDDYGIFGLDKTYLYQLTVPMGLGLNVNLTPKLGLNLQSNFMWTNRDKVDGKSASNSSFATDAAWLHTIGITFNLSKMKDADKDGVADRKDKCANTPAGAFVDKVGCIIDKDKDGIADNLDACPDKLGIAQFNGCPDTDRDGIQDSKDKCIDIAGIAKFDGCPDTDNDGIKDSEDKCPSVYGVSQFSGCPDTDNDGIQDSEDACPNEKGTAQFNGCPDSDGDGLADNKDKCPTVAGLASNNGCPEIKAEVRKLFERALQGVQFESGKSTIKKESFAILNNVITVMIENPSYKLYIAGHTDNAGNADKNLQLSKARAAAVEKYLENKGVSTERVRSEGFGSTVSVADNATKEGRSKNRRVEFKVEFEDIVK